MPEVVAFFNGLSGLFLHDVSCYVGRAFKLTGAYFMKAFVPRLLEKIATVYWLAVAAAYIIFIRKAVPEDYRVIMGTLNSPAVYALLNSVLYTCRAILAGGIISIVVWGDACPETFVKFLKVFFD